MRFFIMITYKFNKKLEIDRVLFNCEKLEKMLNNLYIMRKSYIVLRGGRK